MQVKVHNAWAKKCLEELTWITSKCTQEAFAVCNAIPSYSPYLNCHTGSWSPWLRDERERVCKVTVLLIMSWLTWHIAFHYLDYINRSALRSTDAFLINQLSVSLCVCVLWDSCMDFPKPLYQMFNAPSFQTPIHSRVNSHTTHTQIDSCFINFPRLFPEHLGQSSDLPAFQKKLNLRIPSGLTMAPGEYLCSKPNTDNLGVRINILSASHVNYH